MKALLQMKLGPRVTIATTLTVCGFMLTLAVLAVYTPGLPPRNYLGALFAAAYSGWFLNTAVSMMRGRKPVVS